MIKEAEDDNNTNEYEINVSLGKSNVKPVEYIDKFAGDDIKKFVGVSPALRRKVSRQGGSKKLEEEQYNGYNFFGCVTPPENLDYLARLYQLSAPHNASIKTKVANIVGLGFDLVESHAARDKINSIEDADKKKKAHAKMSRMKSDLYAWIDSLNDEDDFTETLIKAYTDFEATGNGYIEIGRKNTGEIGYFGHIPSTTLRVRQARDGFVQIIGREVVYFRNYGDKTIPNPVTEDTQPNEIIHLKKYSPVNSYYGIPDIMAATHGIAGNEFASRYNLDYFENKAVPRYVIVVKGGKLGQKAQSDIVSFFESAKGENHRTLFVPLPADSDGSKVSFEMKPVENGIQDSSFNNYRNSNNSDIFLVNGVPPSKAGEVSSIGLAAAQDASRNFVEQLVGPAQKILEKKLNRVIAEKTDGFVIKFNEQSLVDQLTQAQIDEIYFRWGVMVPNDVRVERWGKEALPDGDIRAELPATLVDPKVQALQEKTQKDAASAAKTAAAAPKPAAGQTSADQVAAGKGTRQRDQQRAAGATDTLNRGRNAKGAGRSTP